MTNPKFFTDEQQIEFIAAAVAQGWNITRVDTQIGNPIFDAGSFSIVTFAKGFAPPYPPEPIHYAGWETVTQEFGCGFVAARHARELMGQQCVNLTAASKAGQE